MIYLKRKPKNKRNPSKKRLVELLLKHRCGTHPNFSSLAKILHSSLRNVLGLCKIYKIIDRKKQGPIVGNKYLPIPENCVRIHKDCKLKYEKMDKESLKKRLFTNYEVDEKTECWIWLGYWHPRGCGEISFKAPVNKTVTVHAIAAYIWLDEPFFNNTYIYKTCRVAACFNPAHFQICNKSELTRLTIRDSKRKAWSKIGLSKALDIRDALLAKEPHFRIAERLSVSIYTVRNIAQRKYWKHIWKLKHEYQNV